MSEKRNAAIIIVSREHLAKLLDFEGGIITRVSERPEYFRPDDLELLIEHPDLPEVEVGFCLQRIEPTYHSTFAEVEGIPFENIERIDPPKKEAVKLNGD